jgi:hypothetical protein
MIIILSPAKSFATNILPSDRLTMPIFLQEANMLAQNLQRFSAKQLQNICHISANLANINWLRWQNFTLQATNPAIFAFNGDAYKNLDRGSYKNAELDYAQQKIIILSGLYGILSPFDAIKNYRLDMSTSFYQYDFFINNLYEFWQKKVSAILAKQSLIINLCSQEYSDCLDRKQLDNNTKIIDVSFLDNKNGILQKIGINSKKARGSMVDLMIKNKIQTIDEIKFLQPFNYKLNHDLSCSQHLVFVK